MVSSLLTATLLLPCTLSPLPVWACVNPKLEELAMALLAFPGQMDPEWR